MAQSSFEAWKDAPICLSGAPITLAARASATANSGRLQNKYKAPIVIDSIEFSAYYEAGSLDDSWPWSTQVKLSAGPYEITRNYVPMWSFAPALHGEYASLNMEEVTNDACGFTYNTFSGRILNYTHWKLPRPLYMSPGMSINVEFLRGADALSGNIIYNIASHGFSLKSAPAPKEIDVPYVSSFTGSPTTAAQQTQQLQLDNRFKKPLYVQRLVGRLNISDSNIDGGLDATGVKVVVRTYGGFYVVKDFSSFFQVFPARWSALNINEEIQKDEGFVVDIQGVNTGGGVSVNSRPVISLVGCRKEVRP